MLFAAMKNKLVVLLEINAWSILAFGYKNLKNLKNLKEVPPDPCPCQRFITVNDFIVILLLLITFTTFYSIFL